MKIRQKGAQQAIQRCLSEPRVHITSQAVAAEEVIATGQLETVAGGTVAEADLAVVRLLGGQPSQHRRNQPFHAALEAVHRTQYRQPGR